jgi:hypothetical protein
MIPLLLLFAAAAFSQERAVSGPPPKYEVKRATSRVTVDGRLDDAAWRGIPTVELLFPWAEQTGLKQKTTVRLLWDADYLYAAFQCDDADVVAHFDKRDDPTYRDDAVEFFINPKPSQSFYYGLEMNARGTLYDYFYAHPQLLIKRVDFSGVLLATHVDGTLNQTGDKDRGWTLELAIPWRNFEELGTVAAPKPGTVWTANLNRWDGVEPARRLSVWSDSGTVRPSPHNPKRFGQLEFMP